MSVKSSSLSPNERCKIRKRLCTVVSLLGGPMSSEQRKNEIENPRMKEFAHSRYRACLAYKRSQQRNAKRRRHIAQVMSKRRRLV